MAGSGEPVRAPALAAVCAASAGWFKTGDWECKWGSPGLGWSRFASPHVQLAPMKAVPDDVQRGHRLALEICAYCHRRRPHLQEIALHLIGK